MVTLPKLLTTAPRLTAPALAFVLVTSAQLLTTTAFAQPLTVVEQNAPQALEDGLLVGSALAENLDAGKIRAGMTAIRKGAYGNIHSVLIFRRGKLVSESYFPGR